MQSKQVVQATAKVLQSYLTYQAVRTIIDQLSETNPEQAIWLSHYTSAHNIQDGETYIEELMAENKELVLRILTVRAELGEVVLEFLPEMVRSGITEANMNHRCQLLERLTQSPSTSTSPHPETSESDLDLDDSSNL